jgi:hypothetical protein
MDVWKNREHGMKSSGAGDTGDVGRDVSGGCHQVP